MPRPTERASSTGSAPEASLSASVGPSTSSMTRRRGAVLLLEAVDRGDVWVIERGEQARLALEPEEPLRVLREGVWNRLQRDVAMEASVARPVDLAHAAPPDRGDDFVRADAGAGFERHGPA